MVLPSDPLEAKAIWLNGLNKFACADIAVVADRRNDFTVIWIFGLDAKGRIWILDGIYDRMDTSLTLDALFQMFIPPREGSFPHWSEMPLTQEKAALPEKARKLLECWQPEWVALEASVIEETFMTGVREREENWGFVLPYYPIKRISEASKPNRIISALHSPFKYRRIRWPEILVKYSHEEKRSVDIIEKVHLEYDGFLRKGVPDDGLDALKNGAPFFSRAYQPGQDNAIVENKPAPSFLEQVLGPHVAIATEKDVIPGILDVGMLMPKSIDENDVLIDFPPRPGHSGR
ncbi:MAG: hypothetical protein V3W22_04825 [Thermoplasmata archaeon]